MTWAFYKNYEMEFYEKYKTGLSEKTFIHANCENYAFFKVTNWHFGKYLAKFVNILERAIFEQWAIQIFFIKLYIWEYILVVILRQGLMKLCIALVYYRPADRVP